MDNNSKPQEEITTLLRQFRPRPEFATCGAENEWRSQKRKRTYSRGYSSVKYDAACGCKIVFTYLHVQPFPLYTVAIYLAFELGVSTKSIKCSWCSGPNDSISDFVKERMDAVCRDELSCDNSLFSVASRLLQILNNEFPNIYLEKYGIIKGETYHELIRRASVQASKQNGSVLVRTHQLIDLQTLLLRCAAAGRTRSQTLSPVPVEYSSVTSRDGDALAQLVFNASNELYMCGFRTQNTKQSGEKQSATAWELLSFLLSLPILDGKLSKVAKDTMSNGNNKTTRSIIGKLTLELNTGDPTPLFTKHASRYGTIQTYHGTKIESTWSILNHGLQNLSYNKALSQNGAILGEGVYLSSSQKVAEGFAIMAAERPSQALSYAFEHESLLHLLAYANVDIAKLDALDSYDIKCLPVFEATIIRPPENDAEFDKSITRQEGKYFVCEDSEFVRVTKLHLTFELTKKSNVWAWVPRVPFSLIVFFVALIWSLNNI